MVRCQGFFTQGEDRVGKGETGGRDREGESIDSGITNKLHGQIMHTRIIFIFID